MDTKEELRARYQKIRESISPSARKSAGRKIAAQVCDLVDFIGAKRLGVYLSKGSEAETLILVQKLLSKKLAVAAPKVNGDQLEFYQIKSLKDCTTGTFGVMEPKAGCKRMDADQLDLLLVPGLVFDARGYRIGYGKGFYDRFLSTHKIFNTVGLAYDSTTVSELPRDERDVPVNWLVTESGTRCITHEDQ